MDVIDETITTKPRSKSVALSKVDPIQLYFEDLWFSVPIKAPKKFPWSKDAEQDTKWKPLLKGISGTVNPGTMLAIMGSSGAGKTTLLNLLAGRAQGKVEGKVLFNGNPREEAKGLKKKSAYIMQDDILMPSMTPREVLEFAAKLRIGDATPEIIEERVDEIVKELNLTSCQHRRIGIAGSPGAISGSERKRLAIGTEIINNPSLVFFDEPTTGLDSFTAENVVQIMRDLARGGRTIITTIHQPNSDIFQLFDQLLLLAGGEVVYYGPANKVVEYFAGIGYQCPDFTNPADFFMKLVHIDQSSTESKEKVTEFVNQYKKLRPFEDKEKKQPEKKPITNDEKDLKQSYAKPLTSQVGYLLQRSFKDQIRDPLKVRTSLGQTIFMSLLIGLIYLRLESGQSGSQDRLGALFFALVSSTMNSANNVVTTFTSEKALFSREHSNHMYRTTAFYIAKLLSILPMQTLIPTIFSAISYWMIGFNSGFDNFIVFWILVVIIANLGAAIGIFVGVLAKDTSVATSLLPVAVIPFMVFSGFMVNLDTVTDALSWIQYISPFKYGFRAVVINEFKGLSFTCTPEEAVIGPDGALTCRTNSGDQIINDLGFAGANIWEDVGTLVGLWFAFCVLSYLFLLRYSRGLKSNA